MANSHNRTTSLLAARSIRRTSLFLFIGLCVGLLNVNSLPAQQTRHSLNGAWQFQQEGGGEKWKEVVVPNSFEEHEGVEFDGVGIYQKTIPHFELPPNRRAILRFNGVATSAEVWFDGQRIGEHLGGWTPFQFDVTDLVQASLDKPHIIRVCVDEKVGHNSQGFLPVFTPHFGGIWQSVEILSVSNTWIDDLRIRAIGDPTTNSIRLQIPLNRDKEIDTGRFAVRYRVLGREAWSPEQIFSGTATEASAFSIQVPIAGWKFWSPESPILYELHIRILNNQPAERVASSTENSGVIVRAAFRTVQAVGSQIVLNGKPLSVRGVLNWGYAPPRVSPSIDEERFRRELTMAREYGFNLMKFCLWVPPKRYLEIADEMGMLTWIEYPTWHSKWTPDQLPTLRNEFTEFFQFDRNHPSVVLRSLTCETGPSADLDVIRNLYHLCHDMIPGSIVEDDSSWIAWNRIHDFYDDHPYGNNHSWISTITRLQQHIEKHGEKPLVLGEAIAADTWIDQKQLANTVGNERPFWLPNFFDGNQKWIEQIQSVTGECDLDRLRDDSKRYALLMRKYQIEAYRRHAPDGGYVVSVIRDFPFAAMGLIDFLDRRKWEPAEWSWHGDTMLLLETESDRRSFRSSKQLKADILISHFGNEPIRDAQLTVSLVKPASNGSMNPVATSIVDPIQMPNGSLKKVVQINMSIPKVDTPTQFSIIATLKMDDAIRKNHWQVWVMPESVPSNQAVLHSSVTQELGKELFPEAHPVRNATTKDKVVIATKLDEALIDRMQSGGRVMLIPNGTPGSLPLSEEWFLRGAPYISNHSLLDTIPREMLVELQHFDLAGPVVPDIGYLAEIDPILMLWHNHDIDRVKTHGLVFETRIGKGRLLVSALRHDSSTNSAGHWILRELINHLANGPPPQHALHGSTVRQMRESVNEKRIELIGMDWDFKADPENVGLTKQWNMPRDKQDASWNKIRIGRAWEGQGYSNLDGWAWYRINVDIPENWQAQPVYVSFYGVDDYYEVYVGGKRVGSGGDIETKTTAFEERKSHDVTDHIVAGESVEIVVRVFDWYGAGGLFRPVTLGTTPIRDGGAKMLK